MTPVRTRAFHKINEIRSGGLDFRPGAFVFSKIFALGNNPTGEGRIPLGRNPLGRIGIPSERICHFPCLSLFLPPGLVSALGFFICLTLKRPRSFRNPSLALFPAITPKQNKTKDHIIEYKLTR